MEDKKESKELAVIKPEMDIDQYGEQRKSILSLVKDAMRENVDFGIIPGTSKKTLYQAGAEKLAKYFGLIPQFTLLKEIEDWDKGFVFYKYKCELTHFGTGKIVGNCERSCNSRETKYRNKNVYDVANTVKAMAQKRALVAAVRTATMATEIFDDDTPETSGQKVSSAEDSKRVKLLGRMFSTASDRGFNSEQVKKAIKTKFKLKSTTESTNEQIEELIEFLVMEYEVVGAGEKPKKYEVEGNEDNLPRTPTIKTDDLPKDGDEQTAPKLNGKSKCYQCHKDYSLIDPKREKGIPEQFCSNKCTEEYWGAEDGNKKDPAARNYKFTKK